MKHKYLISKGENENVLIIKEFSERDKGTFSMVCEEQYDSKMIESAIAEDKGDLISVVRTPNLFPTGFCAEKIVEGIIAFYGPSDNESIEVMFNDLDLISAKIEPEPEVIVVEEEEELAEIDKLLEDDEIEDPGIDQEKIDIVSSKTATKIVDDDPVDIDVDDK